MDPYPDTTTEHNRLPIPEDPYPNTTSDFSFRSFRVPSSVDVTQPTLSLSFRENQCLRTREPRSSARAAADREGSSTSSNSVDQNATTKKNRKKKERGVSGADDGFGAASSLSVSHRGTRLPRRRQNPRVVLTTGTCGDTNVEAIALPLGMSFAAVVSQVLGMEDAVGGKMSVDYLSEICTSAVRESLSNVFGDKSTAFVRKFEKSFNSTLRTLRLISDSALQRDRRTSTMAISPCKSSNRGGHRSDSLAIQDNVETVLPNFEAVQENQWTDAMSSGVSQHGPANELACITSYRGGPLINQPICNTLERSVLEQTRSNDLKTLELTLSMKKMKLKEEELALSYDSNSLEKAKLAVGMSKVSLKSEKFKTHLEDVKHTELIKKCIDCLVAGLLIMSICITYGAYNFSYQRIFEATASCTPLLDLKKSKKPWWIPGRVAAFNTGFETLRCQAQVLSRMVFGMLMILVVGYLVLQRSSVPNQTMPVTFLLLLLGVVCGFAGKFCVDTLGGSGYNWLLMWEVLCLVHFFANIGTSALFRFLHGPIHVAQGKRRRAWILPYCVRQTVFYVLVLLVLPLLCGLMPFGTAQEWKDHFSELGIGLSAGGIAATWRTVSPHLEDLKKIADPIFSLFNRSG